MLLLRFLGRPQGTVGALALMVKFCPGNDSPHAPQELPPPLVVRHDELIPQRFPRHVQLFERGARQAAGQDLRDLEANSMRNSSAFCLCHLSINETVLHKLSNMQKLH